jgi:hypothetical protein
LENRLFVWVVESRNLLSGAQCAFRRHRSAHDHSVNLEYNRNNLFLLRQHLVAVFFDLEKAYDVTWLCGILRTLHRWNIRGRPPLLLSHFLQARCFRVRLGSVLSALYLQGNRVPQGSVLSDALFAASINCLVNAVGPSVPMSMYADDVAIYSRSRSMGAVERRLQGAIKRLSRWARENDFAVSRDKTKCLHFARLRYLQSDPCLFLRNRHLPFVPTLKFLGLILDSRLSWESHGRYQRVKCERALNILSFIWMILRRRPDSDAPTLSCAHTLQDRSWHLRVCLHQEVQVVCNRPCSQCWTLSCHWRVSHQPSGKFVCGIRRAPVSRP